MNDNTIKFTVPGDDRENMHRILRSVFDALVVAPCTGNTLAKLAHGIADGPVTMAVKSHLRNGRPVLLAVSTNDGLGAAAAH